MLLFIDPGADAGWARFEGKRLVACGLNEGALCLGITKVVIERPHTAKTKAKRKDIITLAIRAGEWGGKCKAFIPGIIVEYLEPATWKGTLSKEISHSRTLAKLTTEEQEVVNAVKLAESKRHNMLDAVGIGLYCLVR